MESKLNKNKNNNIGNSKTNKPKLKDPHAVDKYVGSRVKFKRTEKGFSQNQLGQKLGITFQQVQKYEKGFNRIGSSRLYEISKLLNVQISYFFEDYELEDSVIGGDNLNYSIYGDDPDLEKDIRLIVKHLTLTKDKSVRKSLINFVKDMNKKSDSDYEKTGLDNS